MGSSSLFEDFLLKVLLQQQMRMKVKGENFSASFSQPCLLMLDSQVSKVNGLDSVLPQSQGIDCRENDRPRQTSGPCSKDRQHSGCKFLFEERFDF